MNIHDLFAKVENAEQDFYKTEFVSPVIFHGKIRARIVGLIQEFRIMGNFEGWAILKPCGESLACVVGSPNLLQIEEYLNQFSKKRVVLCERRKDGWYGFSGGTQVKILLADGVSLFDSILVRFDGMNYWFEKHNHSVNPSEAEYLRKSLNESLPFEKLNKPGLDPIQREAYRWQCLLKEKQIGEITLEKIKQAAQFGEGEFLSYIERQDSYLVMFKVE